MDDAVYIRKVNHTPTKSSSTGASLSVMNAEAAANTFTESVALELEPMGVRVRIVIPGRAPETLFGADARGRMGLNIPEAYTGLAAQTFARFQAGGDVTYSRDVAEAVWRAATDLACWSPRP